MLVLADGSDRMKRREFISLVGGAAVAVVTVPLLVAGQC
jgi:hypothetical protein